MEDALRAGLYAAVVVCRRRLEEDLARQLEGLYDIRPTAPAAEPPAHLDAVGLVERAAIEQTLAHYGAGMTRSAAVERFVRESAFTWLNRLAALKLMEHPDRALIQPSVGDGPASRGFAIFALVSPVAMRGQPDGGYRLYLELLADDLALELGALFDRHRPTALLFPGQTALKDVLGLLNDPALAPVWGEDETIGWVYQYFTPTELRQQVRKESAAPRDSHELSFRNQFYTPRYVVDFLAENTLGRLWLERRGVSRLMETGRYLIHPNAPDTDPAAQDPRTIRILDPASGSGHFLLKCYDLLETIYAEAYEASAALRADYPDRTNFDRAVPGLILAHNLHGIDIDRRAVQIARLALWLRAQRSYRALGLPLADRPRLPEAHVVCAEPMPGEADLLAEFGRTLDPAEINAALAHMLPDIWAAMRGVEELGSLLKIERATARIAAETKRAIEALPEGWQMTLFGADRPMQTPLPLRRTGVDDEAFWNGAVDHILAALQDYAQQAGRGAVRRRLFVDDAAEGVAFLDMLHEPFDVVLMNPPFGAPTASSKDYLAKQYPRTKNDLYAAFVERGLELLRPGGYLGAITSRTGFFLTTFQKWREEVLLGQAELIALADLGYGVLDTAMVETAAYVLRKLTIPD
jgi:hypothetical protein